MKMKWEDLEVGDIVTFSDEMRRYYRDYNDWLYYWGSADLRVENIEYYNNYIELFVFNCVINDHYSFYINFDGTAYTSINFAGMDGLILFKIVSLT